MAGYLFDWTKTPPETDDPAWRGRLSHGKHQTVLLNGVEAGDVRRCQTGPDGWVELAVKNPDGSYAVEVYELATGAVPDPAPRWQSKEPQPDGTWRDKYGERLKTVVVKGSVEYVNASHPVTVTT